MKINLQSLFSDTSIIRRMYAIRHGDYKSCFFVGIEVAEDTYNFLSLPEREVVMVPKREFKRGIKLKIVDYIEKIPHNVYTVCKAQYESELKKRHHNSGLKQSTAPGSMDSRKRKKQRKS